MWDYGSTTNSMFDFRVFEMKKWKWNWNVYFCESDSESIWIWWKIIFENMENILFMSIKRSTYEAVIPMIICIQNNITFLNNSISYAFTAKPLHLFQWNMTCRYFDFFRQDIGPCRDNRHEPSRKQKLVNTYKL